MATSGIEKAPFFFDLELTRFGVKTPFRCWKQEFTNMLGDSWNGMVDEFPESNFILVLHRQARELMKSSFMSFCMKSDTFHLRARMVLLFVGSLEVVLSVMNLNQGGSRSKMGCSFRFRCQNCISTQSELKRAIFRIWRRKTNFLFVSVPLKLETRQNIGAFAKWFLAM